MPEPKTLLLIEYHGWAVLYCRDKVWSDEDWDGARDEIEMSVTELRQEDGHAIHMDNPANGGWVVAINGWAETVDKALDLFRRVARVAPDSYGELLVFAFEEPVAKQVVRYVMREGAISTKND